MVTRVARHYHISRVRAKRTVLSAIAVTNSRDDALEKAFEAAATGRRRVFMYEHAGTRHCLELDRAKP